jgi:hypothetical protein
MEFPISFPWAKFQIKKNLYICRNNKVKLLIMKNIAIYFTGIFLFLQCTFTSNAQDTIEVQTFTFDDISKRRGWYVFPESTKTYRKILMFYTLKCDPLTPHDKYNCGEWDYETRTYIYDHNATYDSTFKSLKWFHIGANEAPDTFFYTTDPVIDRYAEYQYQIHHDTVYSLDSFLTGQGSLLSDYPLKNTDKIIRAQYIWSKDELTQAGMDSGAITGIRFYAEQAGSEIKRFHIQMAACQADSFSNKFINATWTSVFINDIHFSDSGWYNIQFNHPFLWNGQEGILAEFSFDHEQDSTTSTLLRASPGNKGLVSKKGNSYLHFNTKGDYVSLGIIPGISENKSRTIELWAKVDAFNNAGLFQCGGEGVNGADFSLRTQSQNDQWRIQLWGIDHDISIPGSKNSWHHYALVYDGSKVILYYDGEKITEKTVAINTLESDFRLGRWSNSFLNGSIDEVRIWNKALDQKDIQEWMHRSVNNNHPDYSALRGYYPCEEGEGNHVEDQSPKNNSSGQMHGNTWWQKSRAAELFMDAFSPGSRPDIIFEQGLYASSLDSQIVVLYQKKPPVRVFIRNNPATGIIIPEDHKQHPSMITDTLLVYPAHYYDYIYDPDNQYIIDSILIDHDDLMINKNLEWYSPDVVYEIGRFITPYGINLDLGIAGFTWVYDVTDYAALLHDSVEISSANLQELHDLKFVMIEGNPPRDVLNIQQLWNQGRSSYKYKDLDNDAACPPVDIKVKDQAKGFKLRTRLSGHGHHSNDGNYPHCCEWKDNTHYIYVNNQKVDEWHIWRDDCNMNPVYPQGGTWNGSREGWCPGDVVQDQETEITDFVSGNSVNIDYRITPVPANNQGMGNGNYLFAMHLMEYGEAHQEVDAEVYEIITPNNFRLHSRVNPVCHDPRIVIRNSGSKPLTSLDIEYHVEGGQTESYHWTGHLKFMEKALLVLPVSGQNFWVSTENPVFHVEVKNPNGEADAYNANDKLSSQFDMPDLYDDNFIIYLKTNNYPDENYYEISNIQGEVVYRKDNLEANKIYRDTLNIGVGCYTFRLYDEGYGLSYWAWPDQGSGVLRFRSLDNKILKTFEPDFGKMIHYPFSIGYNLRIKDPNITKAISIYPNPAKKEFFLNTEGLEGSFHLRIINSSGQEVHRDQILIGDYENRILIRTDCFRQGIYFIQLFNSEEYFNSKVIISGKNK